MVCSTSIGGVLKCVGRVWVLFVLRFGFIVC